MRQPALQRLLIATITIETCVTTVNVGNEFSRLIRRHDRDDLGVMFLGAFAWATLFTIVVGVSGQYYDN